MKRAGSDQQDGPVTGGAIGRWEPLGFDGSTKLWNNTSAGATTGALDATSMTAWPTFPGNVAEYASVPNNAELQAINDCTLEAWVKYSAVGGSQCIFGKWKTFGGITSTGTDLRFYDPGGAANRPTGFVLGNGVWYHIALCCTNGAPGSATVYVNGVAVATDAWTKMTTDYSWPFIVGQFPGFWPLAGDVDSARLYDRALSDDEVVRNYQAGLAGHQ